MTEIQNTKKQTKNRISAVMGKDDTEFPLSRHMDVSRPSHDIAHEEACFNPTGVYIKPQEPFALKLKAGQDSSATSLQIDYNNFYE